MTGVACGVSCKIVAEVNAPVPGAETENILTWKIGQVKSITRRFVPILRDGDDRSGFVTDKRFQPIIGNRRDPGNHGTGNESKRNRKYQQDLDRMIAAALQLVH